MSEQRGTVFLVDDDTGALKATSNLLRAAGYFTQSFTSPLVFLDNHDPALPGCAIFDLSMPELNGLQLQAALANKNVGRPIIFLTGRADIRQTVEAMKGGAIDFLTKPIYREELLSAVALAMAHDADRRRDQIELSSIMNRVNQLTLRERQVLTQVVAGRLNKQIAGDLGTVEKTIKVHRGRMMAKMGVRTVAELVTMVARAGIRVSS